MTATDTTVDSIVRGLLSLEQPRKGYRFSIDAILLADHVFQRFSAPQRVVDLGAGCGIVGLLLARRWVSARVALVEIQSPLATLARRNVERNGLDDRVEVEQRDLRAGFWGREGERTVLVSNPPFFRPEQGRVSPDPTLAAARHEVSCSLEELLAAMGTLSAGDGAALIHQAARREEIVDGLFQAGFSEIHVKLVYPLAGRAPSRILVSGERGGTGERTTKELPALIVNEPKGRYSAEVRAMLGEPLGDIR